MTALEDISAALAAAVQGVEGLQGYDHVPAQVNVPAAVVRLEGITYDAELDHGATYSIPIDLVVSLGDWESAGKQMQALASHDGEVVTAINAVTEFDCQVKSAEGGQIQVGDTLYGGVRLTVEVYA